MLKYWRNENEIKKTKKSFTKSLVGVLCILIMVIASVMIFKNYDGNSSTDEPTTESTTIVTTKPTQTTTQTTTEETTVVTTMQTTEKVTVAETKVEKMNKTMYVTASYLNVRKKPTTDSKILGQIPYNHSVKVTGKTTDNWYQVEYEKGTGYCHSAYLSENKKESGSPYYIKVNRTQNIVIIYKKDDNGDYSIPYKSMICSVGTDGKTPTGTYNTTAKYTWLWLSGNVYGQYATRIVGPYLFHSVPYFTQDKSDLEYEEYNKLGQAASLGCVRLSVKDAKWIYDNCPVGTTVTIYDSDETEPLEKPKPIRIDTSDKKRRGWDPTDPDSRNPWKKSDD